MWPLSWRPLEDLEEFIEQREETGSAKLTQDCRGQEWTPGKCYQGPERVTAAWPGAVASETEGRLAWDDLGGTEDRSWCVLMWEVKEAKEVSGGATGGWCCPLRPRGAGC